MKKNQKTNINTHIVCNTKGGVGKTITGSMILPLILHSTETQVSVYEIDDNNQISISSNHIKFKSIQIRESEDVLDQVYFDSFSQDENKINIIDCGGGNDTKAILNSLAQSDMNSLNYYIPINDDYDQVDNVKTTIKLIKSFDSNPTINLILNRCISMDKTEIKKQFSSLFGDDEIDLPSRIEQLEFDNIFFIPNTNIFSLLKSHYQIALLDSYINAADLVANKDKYHIAWQQEGEEKFMRNMKMFRFAKKVLQLVEQLQPLKKSLGV